MWSIIVFLFANGAVASSQVALVTQVQGTVKIFSHPGKSLEGGPAPRVKFEGEYFTESLAKGGEKIENKNLVLVPIGGAARLIYENGDQINIGSGTSYRVSFAKDTKEPAHAKPVMDLKFGSIRGIIQKSSDRTGLKIRTASATMGVRGTDFFISHGGKENKTDVSLLRGKVEVTPDGRSAKKPIVVEPGYSASIPKYEKNSGVSADKILSPKIELKQISKQELVNIQKSSDVKSSNSSTGVAAADKKIIEDLEKKAVESTLTDIKKEDPALYKEIIQKKVDGVSAVNLSVIQKVFKTAPSVPEVTKPSGADLVVPGDRVYDDYYKILSQ